MRVKNKKFNHKSLLGYIQPGQRLDIAIQNNWPEKFSRSQAQKFIHQGLVSIDENQIQKPGFKSKKKSRLTLVIPEFSESSFSDFSTSSISETSTINKNTTQNSKKDICILYEDNDLAIVHKHLLK